MALYDAPIPYDSAGAYDQGVADPSRDNAAFYRRTADKRLALVLTSRAAYVGYGSGETWEQISDVFTYDGTVTGHDTAMDAVRTAWGTHSGVTLNAYDSVFMVYDASVDYDGQAESAGSDQATTKAAIDAALNTAGYRRGDRTLLGGPAVT